MHERKRQPNIGEHETAAQRLVEGKMMFFLNKYQSVVTGREDRAILDVSDYDLKTGELKRTVEAVLQRRPVELSVPKDELNQEFRSLFKDDMEDNFWPNTIRGIPPKLKSFNLRTFRKMNPGRELYIEQISWRRRVGQNRNLLVTFSDYKDPETDISLAGVWEAKTFQTSHVPEDTSDKGLSLPQPVLLEAGRSERL
jgi:hypothetical protein